MINVVMGLRFMWVRYSFVRSWEGWGGKFEKVSQNTLGNRNKIICCDVMTGSIEYKK